MMLLFSDLHLEDDTAETVFSEVLPGIFLAAKERGIRAISFLGDFWHLRYRVSVKLQTAVRDEFRRWVADGIFLRILPGNHDQIDLRGRNAMEVYDAMDISYPVQVNEAGTTMVYDWSEGLNGRHGGGCRVYTDPGVDEWGLWVPYRKDIRSLETVIRQYADPSRTLFMHHGVRGAWMNDRIQDTDGIEAEKLSGYKAVLLGHYHKRQQIGNAYYIGSPYQVSAHEAGQEKGYAIWNGESLEWVTTRWGPQIYQLEASPGALPDLSHVRAGDDVRIKAKLGTSVEAIAQVLEERGARYVITPEQEVMEARLQVSEGASLTEYARAYVNQVETALNRETLMQAFQEILR